MIEYVDLWKGGLGDEPTIWLRHHGWTAQRDAAAEVAARYDRQLPVESAGSFVIATAPPWPDELGAELQRGDLSAQSRPPRAYSRHRRWVSNSSIAAISQLNDRSVNVSYQ